MLRESEKRMLQKLDKEGNKLKIEIINSHNQELFLKFELFCNEIKKVLPDLNIAYIQEELPAYPAMKLTSVSSDFNLYYLAIPEGKEWPPFFNALTGIIHSAANVWPEGHLSKTLEEEIRQINHPLEVKVFIAPHCVFCPLVVDLANQISLCNSLIKTYIIDATLYPKLAKQYKITASPTVVINEDFILVGNEARENLPYWLKKAAQSQYDTTVIKSLLKQAQAERVVTLCLEDERHLETLLNLLTDKELFPRIGAMRVLEELRDKAPQKIEKILPKLLKMLQTQDTRDKGDILFLLGIIGTPEVLGEIESLASREDGEIKEIAVEAIEEIKRRYQFC